MKKILSVNQAIKTAKKLHGKKSKIVLVGGVFDILHIGHIRFLESAKKEGDFLFVLLESDISVRKKKGIARPLNRQKERSQVLAALIPVDFIIILKGILKDKDYDKIIKQIRPDILATTARDSYIFHKERQAKLVGAKVKTVIKRVKSKSTTGFAEKLETELGI